MFPRAAILSGIGICFGILPVTVTVQEPPVLVSPDARPDRTVVFRFWAPKANDVQLVGDWMNVRRCRSPKTLKASGLSRKGHWNRISTSTHSSSMECGLMTRLVDARTRSGRDEVPRTASQSLHSRRRRGRIRIGRQARFITSDSFRNCSSACAGSSFIRHQDMASVRLDGIR